MDRYLLLLCGMRDSLPVGTYPTLDAAKGAVSVFGPGSAKRDGAPLMLKHAARVWGDPSYTFEGWRIVEFQDGVPVQCWAVGFDDPDMNGVGARIGPPKPAPPAKVALPHPTLAALETVRRSGLPAAIQQIIDRGREQKSKPTGNKPSDPLPGHAPELGVPGH